MSAIASVILCGGSGTRLWPMSRASDSKALLAEDDIVRFKDAYARDCA